VNGCDRVLPADPLWFEELTAAFMTVSACGGRRDPQAQPIFDDDVFDTQDDDQECTSESVMQLFSALDSDDKGMLNAALLPDVGKALRGKLWSSKMFTAVCSELAMPVSSIRRVSPLQFEAFILECLKDTTAVASEAVLRALCEEALVLLHGGSALRRRQRLLAVFQMLDVKARGGIEQAELRRIFTQPGRALTGANIVAKMQTNSMNRNNVVDATEFVSSMDNGLPKEDVRFDKCIHEFLVVAEELRIRSEGGVLGSRIWPPEDELMSLDARMEALNDSEDDPLYVVTPSYAHSNDGSWMSSQDFDDDPLGDGIVTALEDGSTAAPGVQRGCVAKARGCGIVIENPCAQM